MFKDKDICDVCGNEIDRELPCEDAECPNGAYNLDPIVPLDFTKEPKTVYIPEHQED